MSTIICVSNTDKNKIAKMFDLPIYTCKTQLPSIVNSAVFDNIYTLANAYTSIVNTPILVESSFILENISLNHNTFYADFNVARDGIITFFRFKKKKVSKLLKEPWKPSGLIFYEKDIVHVYGKDNSEFTKCFNNFLITLPPFIHSATIVAFITSIHHEDWNIFNQFLLKNRLITNVNSKLFDKLAFEISKIQHLISLMLNANSDSSVKEKFLKRIRDTDSSTKFALKRIRFYLNKYGSLNLDTFLDDEDNVNLVKTVIKNDPQVEEE